MTRHRLFRSCAMLLPALWMVCPLCLRAQQSYWLLSDPFADKVRKFDAATGAFISDIATGASGLDNPSGMVIGPDGALNVASSSSNDIRRYDLTYGQYLGVFATGAAIPVQVAYRPDHNLYVSSRDGQGILKYNGSNGTSQGLFATAPVSDLWWAWDMEWRPNGSVFLSSYDRGFVLRFNGTGGASPGAYLGIFASGNDGASGIAFGPDGNLYVANPYSNLIRKFNGTTGAPLGIFASGHGLNSPTDIAFGPEGYLYVANGLSGDIQRFDLSGNFIDTFITTPGPNAANDFLLFVPEPGSILSILGSLILLGIRHRECKSRALASPQAPGTLPCF